MMQGILFDDIHSHRDLNLILSKEDRPPAKPKTNYIDIPGSDIPIDLTEANGEVRYNSRNFTFTFSFMGQDDSAWEAKRMEVSNLLNGKACKITLDKDPEFYWLGRCTVSKILSDRRKKQIVVTAKVHPYKYKHNETVATFDLSAEESSAFLLNSRKTVCPVITCTNDNTMICYDGNSMNLAKGYEDVKSTNKGLTTHRYKNHAYVDISGTATGLVSLALVGSYELSKTGAKILYLPAGTYQFVVPDEYFRVCKYRKSETGTTIYNMTTKNKLVLEEGTWLSNIWFDITEGDSFADGYRFYFGLYREGDYSGTWVDYQSSGNIACNFSAGTHKNLNIRFTEGINKVTISGSGQVTFAYQEGEL